MKVVITFIFLFIFFHGYSQQYSGKIRDQLSRRMLIGVKVLGSIDSTISNNQGEFKIKVAKSIDTVQFFLQGYKRKTVIILNENRDNIAYITLSPHSIEIETVQIEGKAIKKDSLNFDISKYIPKTPTHRKIFKNRSYGENGHHHGFLAKGSTATLFTIDILRTLNLFRKKSPIKNKENELEIEDSERENIDIIFSTKLISEITGLKDDQIVIFQNMYRPSYFEIIKMSEYELRTYIKNCWQQYKNEVQFNGLK